MKKLYLSLLILMLSFKMGFSQAQLFNVHYTIGFPVSKLADHIEVVSSRGFGLDFRYFVNDNVTIGFGASWSAFSAELPYDTVTFGTVTAIGKQLHHFTSVPIHAYLSYYLGIEEAPIRPFAGIGIGTTWNEKQTQVGDFKIQEIGWQFSLQPELGFLFKATDYNSLLISGRFNYPFKSVEIDSYPYFTLNIGLSFGMKSMP